ncbi:winged helix-turn-helix transcriptional regulator [Streptomyces griseofuscus]|uniref:winged helix-turn-helix transcriptional regulator n=1 Tax=Streptomyces griseofuscus TaxID=146922 RepID=UPI0036A48D2B
MPKPTRPVVFQHGQAFLAAISERWNYQILREVFFGVHRFGELKRGLGISATMLTARLNDLVGLGLLEKHAYREDKPWYEYRLTDGARELVVPAIVAVTRWARSTPTGRRWRCGPSCTRPADTRRSPISPAATATSPSARPTCDRSGHERRRAEQRFTDSARASSLDLLLVAIHY